MFIYESNVYTTHIQGNSKQKTAPVSLWAMRWVVLCSSHGQERWRLHYFFSSYMLVFFFVVVMATHLSNESCSEREDWAWWCYVSFSIPPSVDSSRKQACWSEEGFESCDEVLTSWQTVRRKTPLLFSSLSLCKLYTHWQNQSWCMFVMNSNNK